ncbi:hypothetical protein CAPTEDRAFT_225841 [Capitella teleta]|uniref:Nucleotide-diphospho-sugar transferase domain-containing protein n=1 Tax=Capitella teleta TaxID=283909 RepID=R7ULD5_CAPTE|nr:hypothetical protein CAPTEDRAFT_225841 [Capitella teleta]|eukprot:ELU04613.1 hypothetical protein CAPTEDRAFT_225841 [Capitella teleta]
MLGLLRSPMKYLLLLTWLAAMLLTMISMRQLPSSNLPNSAKAFIRSGPNSLCDNAYVQTCRSSRVYTDLKTALEERASDDKVIIMSGMIEGEYLDLAINQHIRSVAPLKLCNMLYFISNESMIDRTQELNMPVLKVNTDFKNNEVGDFASAAFNEKSKVKLAMVYAVLQLGYKILIADLDVVFLKNPLDVVKSCGKDCDIAVQNNTNKQLNTGFLYSKPTPKSIAFYKKITEKMVDSKGHDQSVFNMVYKRNMVPGINIHVLPVDVACVGSFAEPRKCHVFHANFKKLLAPKIRILKQHGMWKADSRDVEEFLCR